MADCWQSGSFNLSYIALWVGCFSGFAFILTLAREIIKDAEDLKGDTSYGRRTLPAVAGMAISKAVVYCLVCHHSIVPDPDLPVYLPDRFTLIYIIVLLILPLAAAIFLTLKANIAKAFSCHQYPHQMHHDMRVCCMLCWSIISFTIIPEDGVRLRKIKSIQHYPGLHVAPSPFFARRTGTEI